MRPRPHSLLVLAISGLLGFRLGWVSFPNWQVAVETAQVVAGVVRYPSATPFFVYHIKLWTILHQLLAIGLRLGVSEIRLSLIVSALAGMLSLQALSILVYGLSGDALLAVGAAFLIFFSRASEFGVTYPIYLMGASDTYGMVGLSLSVLIAGLFGAGCDRTAFFLAGVAPAVHPSIGLWLALILTICFVWDRDALKGRLQPAWKYLLAGCSVTAASALVQIAGMRGLSPIDAGLSETYLKAFVELWDVHRAPVRLVSGAVMVNAGALALALTWLTACSSDLAASARLLLRIVIVSALLSLTFALTSWIPPDRLPQAFEILMPARLLNLNAMMAPALLIGLIGVYRRSVWSSMLILMMSAGVMLGRESMLWTWLERHDRAIGLGRTNTLVMLGVTAAALIALALAGPLRHETSRTSLGAAARIGRATYLAMFFVLMVVAWGVARPAGRIFNDRTNDPLFKAVSEGSGILATAGNLHLIQLRTRRPVLVDGGGIDGLPYALESAPETDRVLRDVYGIDFFHPPEDARGGRIPPDANQIVWERFSVEDWRRVKRAYGVTAVLTWTDWTLHLPTASDNGELRLYSIPE